ncbi:hypothetical protein CNR22_23080 [Sphingobacteriaceae bacterium]|nr:hypothetical protein CNR22_23080 [Sphingobacteriaceae bacterium]
MKKQMTLLRDKINKFTKIISLRLVCFLFILTPTVSYATHVVGGVLNYSYNGNNVYTIKLLLYRDCGSSSAALPSNVTISIRGANGGTFSPSIDLTINLGTVTTLPSNLAACAVTPNPLPCVQEGVYTKTISLPSVTGGYHLYYQVVARNLSLTNINSSCNCVGESFYAYVPSTISNNNAVFNLFPPLFICVNKPFSFNHSATDSNGDSLAYSLYAPYDGDNGTGSLDPTFPSNTASFTPVGYLSGYTATTPLGASPFFLNATTGVLTCTPSTIGQFVVGVKVKEYRNGVFISQTLRDFQFNVLSCPTPPPTLAINNFTINNGCSIKVQAGGISAASATWTSIFPGTIGTYSNYLSCTAACLNPTVSAPGSSSSIPSYVDFRVCGTSTNCGAAFICDTFRVSFNSVLSVSVLPANPALCNGQSSTTITAVGSGGTPPYSYLWNNINPSQTINVGSGTYSIKLTDASGCPPVYNSAVVTTYTVPITVNAGANQTLCAQNPVTPLGGTVTGATGGLWSGGTGTFSPNNSATANLFYSPSPSEITTGSVSLFLTSSGNGSCPSKSDTVVIYYKNFTGTLSPLASMASCYGGTNGSATVSILGGIGPHTYTWSTVPVQTTSFALNLQPGSTYTAWGTNGIGCTFQTTVAILQPPPLNSNGTITNVSCNGLTNGSVSIIAMGGTPPYTYSWSPGGAASASVNTLSAGVYSVKVTDSKSCQASFTYTVTQPASITAVFSQTHVSCFNGTNGSINLTVGGGIAPYSYSWAPNGATAQNLSGLSAGNYTVFIRDNMNCLSTQTITLTQPSLLTLTVAVVNQSCDGLADGSAAATVSGGAGGYIYLWQPSSITTSSLSNLASGNYTVVVSDMNSCATSSYISVTKPAPLTVSFISQLNVSCNGGSNGMITANVAGGTPNYAYSWSPGGLTTATANSLSAGTYTVMITDSKSCSVTNSVTITQPSALSVTGTTVGVSCWAGNDGSVLLSPGGGSSPYTFFWLPLGQSTASISNLTAGTYTSSLTDNKGCSISAVYVIPQSPQIIVTFTQTNVSCFNGNNGSITTSASGGAGPYVFQWMPVNSSSQNITGLGSGIYTLTVTDNLGCTNSKTASITQPPLLALTTTVVNETCDYLNNGSVFAAGYGGTPGYTYLWLPGSNTTNSVTNLSAGNYSLTLSDTLGCTITTVVVVTEPAALSLSFSSQVNVSCNGGSNGAVTASPSGGTPNYSYSWSPGGSANAMANSLSAGIYSCLISDSHSCVTQNTVSVLEPANLNLIPTITDVNCNGSANGAISISMSGGTAPYVQTLIPGNISASNFSSLLPGTYTIVTTDAHACIINTTLSINQPITITSVISTTNSACLLQSGLASIEITSGGIPPFSYSWTPAGGTSTLTTGLYAGTYTVAVLDSSGCVSTKIVNINDTGGPVVSILSTTNVSCHSGFNGAVEAGFSGGTGPSFTYSWIPAGGNSLTATNLPTGIYAIKVTDALGCIGIVNSSLITEPLELSVTLSLTDVLCYGGSNGAASASVYGGTPAYTFTWLPAMSSGNSVMALPADNYTLQVSDNNNCSVTSTFAITQPSSALSLSLSPAGVSCFGGNNGAVINLAAGGTGPHSYNLAPGNISGLNFFNLTPAIYTITTTDFNNCALSKTVAVDQPSAISLTISAANSNCSLANGQATVLASGGTGTFSYGWFPSGGTNFNAVGLSAGAYTVTVSDANNCVAIAGQTLSDNPAPAVSVSVTANVKCFGGSDGAVNAVVTGGTGPFTYSWSPSTGNASSVANLPAGTYTVLVSSANTCSVWAVSAAITQPSPLFAMVSTTSVQCFGETSGSATALSGGGIPAYSYTWLPVAGTGTSAIGLAASNCTLLLSDANNCTLSSTFVIAQPSAALSVSILSFTNVSCFSGNDGAITSTLNGGTPVYNFNWHSASSTGPSILGLPAGSYSLTVTDLNSCTADASLTITQPASALSASAITSSITCFGSANGSATITPSGGTPGYVYVWNPNVGNTNVITGLSPGTYVATITDLNGCLTNLSLPITQPSALAGTVTAIHPACAQANGSVFSQLAGGTIPYSYTWSAGASTASSISGLTPGTYSLLISDNNYCLKSFSITISNIPGPTVTVVSKSVSCFDGNNGSATVSIAQGSAPFVINWTPYGGNAVAASSLTQGTYTATVIDARGCESTASTNITEPSQLVLAIASVTNVACANGSNAAIAVAASGGVPAYSFSWQPSGVGNIKSNLSAGIYTVNLKDNNNCKRIMSIQITQPTVLTSSITNIQNALCYGGAGNATVVAEGGTAPYTYTWSPGAAQNGNTLLNAPSKAYAVNIKDANGCATSNTLFISQPSQIKTTVSNNDTICIGSAGILTASATGGTGGFYYSWQPANVINTGVYTLSPSANTSYTVSAFDQNGCFGVDADTKIIVYNFDSQNVKVFGASPICPGAVTSVFIETHGNTGHLTYAWNDNLGSGPGVYVVSPGKSKTYYVTVTNACGKSVQDSIYVIVRPLPLVDLTADTLFTCTPGTINFSDKSILASAGDDIASWQWSFGDNTFSTKQNPSHLYSAEGVYSVNLSVTTSEGCTNNSDTSLVVTSLPKPTASFSTNAAIYNLPYQEIVLSNTSTGAIKYNWFFQDGGSSDLKNPKYLPQTIGLFNIELIALSSYGCADTAFQSVETKADITFPTAFTPNNEHAPGGYYDVSSLNNDIFFPYTSGVVDFEMQIFNRWGELIFESKDVKYGWDGYYRNKICQVGVYFWKAHIKLNDGREFKTTGDLTLLK